MSHPVNEFAGVPVVIFCGGNGIFIDGTGTRRNKSLVPVAQEPLVAHVIRIYLRVGFRTFVLAAGYQYEALLASLKSGYASMPDATNPALLHATVDGVACSIRVVSTGEIAPTGERLKACMPYLKNQPWFCVTYSDTLSDVNLADMYRFHKHHGKVASLLAAQYPTRFRILGIRGGESEVRGFSKHPVLRGEPINGGFYFFSRRIFDDHFLEGSGVVLEDAVLDRLAAARELMAYPYVGAWQNLDAERDLVPLTGIANSLRQS